MADASPTEPALHPSTEVAGNRLTILAEGADRLAAVLDLIDSAKYSLRILYYMFKDDESGRRVRDALIAACARGVRVSILVDGFGSSIGDAFFRPLLDNRCSFCRFEPRFGRRYLLRNHQKLLLADGREVISGGFNIANEYFGDVASGAWRDLGIRIEGPAVATLCDYFDDLFAWTADPHSRIRDMRRILKRYSGHTGKLRWLLGGPTRHLSPWAQAVRQDMATACRLDLIAAYFAPSRAMLRRIYGVAERGTARVITAAKSDNGATIGAARHSYWRMLKRGVEVYEYQPTKLHTKLIVIDDVVHIGSANFDMRSFFLNLEMMVRIDDASFAAEMRELVQQEIGASKQITRELHRKERSWFNRLKWALCYFVVATMDYSVARRLNFGIDGR
jgi:cardiolipin synthase